MILETYEFIRKLPVDWIAFFAAYPYPKTEMTNILLKKGVITEDDLIDIWDSATQGFKQRPFDTEEISGKELTDLIYDFNIELNFFSNYNIRTGHYADVLMKLDKIILRYPFHIIALVCRAKCYYEINRNDDASKDIAMIIDLIKVNSESQKLLRRYGERIRATLSPYDPSVELFRLL
jgi:anaerobic magnesium-protoporphyrin IX monomethyl ester cyclase